MPNHEAIKAFEALFANVQDSIPSSLDDVQSTADNAQMQAAEALGQLANIANALSLALYGAYSENISPDNYIQNLEQIQQDIYIPPLTLDKNFVGLSNVQNVDQTNAANLTSGTLAPERGYWPLQTVNIAGSANVVNWATYKGDSWFIFKTDALAASIAQITNTPGNGFRLNIIVDTSNGSTLTLTHNTSFIRLKGNVDAVMTSQNAISLISRAGIWFEISRNF